MDVLSISPRERSTLEISWEHLDRRVEVVSKTPTRPALAVLPRPAPAFTISPIRTVVDIEPNNGDLVTLPKTIFGTINRVLKPYTTSSPNTKQSLEFSQSTKQSPTPPPKQALKNRVLSPSDAKERTYRKCQAVFNSRNALFKHVFSNTCSSSDSPPSSPRRRHRKRRKALKSYSPAPTNSTSPASPPAKKVKFNEHVKPITTFSNEDVKSTAVAAPPKPSSEIPSSSTFSNENVKSTALAVPPTRFDEHVKPITSKPSSEIPSGRNDNEDVVSFSRKRAAYPTTRTRASSPPAAALSKTASTPTTASQFPKLSAADLVIPTFKPKAKLTATDLTTPALNFATPECPPDSQTLPTRAPAPQTSPARPPPASNFATPAECPTEKNKKPAKQPALPALRPASRAP